MATGWIKIYREIQGHWIWQDEKYLKWWLTIVLNVNYESKKFPVGTELFVCNPGQSFRSIEQWTDMFSCSKPTTLKFFEMLKKDDMIQTKIVGSGNRRKHLLTVVNWAKYQQTETENFTETVPKTLPKINPNVPPNKNNKKENNNHSVIFDQFRIEYPGTKRGLKTEYENFIKKNSPETIILLLPALISEKQHREELSKVGQFVPQWKNLSTWINQKCWEQEFPEVKKEPGGKIKSLSTELQFTAPKIKAI
jgi:hypothetical protein